MGKIFDALEKFKNEKKSSPEPPSHDDGHQDDANMPQDRMERSRNLSHGVPVASKEGALPGEDPYSGTESSACEETEFNEDQNLLQDISSVENAWNQGGCSEKRARTGGMDTKLITLFNHYTSAAEQFRKLKTKLLFPDAGKPPRSIMVTSAFPGEGKTFVASNLAVTIAQGMDEYVLLMDCDMRLPDIHTWFGCGDVPGLSEYLNGTHSLSSLLIKTELDKLTLLPGGTPPPNPSELLSSGQMTRLFKEVKDRYNDRFIVVDSPPPRLTAESRALAMQMDGILLVVKHGSTSKEHVTELIEIVGREKILGVVYNYFDGGYKFGAYGGGYGQYYGGMKKG